MHRACCILGSSIPRAFSRRPTGVGARWAYRIEAMNEPEATLSPVVLEQVYLIERDTGLLCRILALYAARGIDVQRADYAYAARDVMTLKVAATSPSADIIDALRVLVAKAATLVGVIAAAEQPRPPESNQYSRTAESKYQVRRISITS
jgi:hypothetical protein